MGKFTFKSFVIDQWTALGPPLTTNLDGKTVVVIGATSGIGLEAARHFARMKPARLILGCRNEARGRAAIEDIARDTNFAAELQLVDLEDFSSVTAFAERLEDIPIDILVANAGVYVGTAEYKLTNNGWESQLQTNYLSTALLSLLLVPNLIRAGQEKETTSRLVITTSSLHMEAHLSEEITASPNLLKKLNSPEVCTPKMMETMYHTTKLLEVFFTRALADHLPLTAPLLPTCVEPGYCRSQLRRTISKSMVPLYTILDCVLAYSSEEGSRNLLYAALGPDGEEGAHQRIMRGAYVAVTSVREPSDYVISKKGYELQERLWNETIEILEAVAPTVRSIVNAHLQ